jgi:uncharacterized membrane protein
MTTRARLRPYVISTLVFSTTAALPANTLRLLPINNPDHFGYGLSLAGNGSVAGYTTCFETPVPVLWTKSTTDYAAPASLPQPVGGVGGEARWISPDGVLAAGYAALASPDSSLNQAPVLWTRGSNGAFTATALPRLAGSPAEGSVIAGSANGSRLAGVDGPDETATVWRGTPGSAFFAQALPLPGGAGHPSIATAASADGARLAGRVTTTTTGNSRAVVWNESGGAYTVLALQSPAGATQTSADALSADGTLVAGTSENNGLYTATRWDAATGQATLLEARAGADTSARSISADKHWIGGLATHRADGTQTAVLWDGQGKVFTLTSLAANVDFGTFAPAEISAIHVVSPGVYTVAGTGSTFGSGQTIAFVIENLALPVPGVPTPDTPPPSSPPPPTTNPPPPTTEPPATPPPPTAPDLLSTTPRFDPASSESRVLSGDAYAAIFDITRATTWRFANDQAAQRPLRVTFPGTSRDSLAFDGSRALAGPRAQDLFAPGVAQDMAFVGAVRIPATGGGGKAVLFSINHSPAEPALALGYDYGQGRFYAVFLQAFNGAPSEIAGPASPRGGTYVVRLQKTGGVVSLHVNGVLLAQTNSARPAILASGQGAPLGLGGVRTLSPQFVGQLGRFHLRNTALSPADALALEADLRATWLGDGTTTPPPTNPPPPTSEPPPTTPPPTTPPPPPPPPPPTTPPATTAPAAVFNPAATDSRTLVNNAYAALFDPALGAWRFATDQAAIRPARVAFPGTTRDSLGFDGSRVLPGPRSGDLFAPGVAQDLGFVAAVRIPATGGSGRATLFTVNRSDTEPAIGVGYDYSSGRFFAHFTQAFNGAPSVLTAGSVAARGATHVVSLQKTGGTVRLRVNGVVVAETTQARPAILASGQNGHLGLGGIRALNPQFVGQLGKFHLRAGALSDAEATTLEADVRAWTTP